MVTLRRRTPVATTEESEPKLEEERLCEDVTIVVDDSSSNSAVKHLRGCWELASVLNFLNVFGPLVADKLKLTAEEFEMGLIEASTTNAQLHIALLKRIPPVNKSLGDTNVWITVLCKKLAPWWPWIAEREIPITDNKCTTESQQAVGLANEEPPSQAWYRDQSKYPMVSSTLSYSSRMFHGGMQYQASLVSMPHQVLLPTPPSNNYDMYSQGSHQAVSQPMRQQYQPEAPMHNQNHTPVSGAENPASVTNLEPSGQAQQQLQPFLPGAGQGTADGEVDKNQPYHTTL